MSSQRNPQPNRPRRPNNTPRSRSNPNSRNPTPSNPNSRNPTPSNPNSRNPTPSKSPATKQSGQKGAEAHTVSESCRIQLTKKLLQMREDDTLERIELSNELNNTERKFAHELAKQLGLKSKSSGKGEDRRIAISKPDLSLKPTDSTDDDRCLPELIVGKHGMVELKRHINLYPPSPMEHAESHLTGSYLQNSSKDETLLEALNELDISTGTYQPKTKTLPQPFKVSRKQRSLYHHQAQHLKLTNPQYPTVLSNRQQLPACTLQSQILHTIQTHPVTVINGDTGCGKSTQIPQFLLDSPSIGPHCNILITQPRRISAIMLAERIASERLENVGQTVGYHIRLESEFSPQTQLTFVTPGILLQMLNSSPGLEEYTHVILDEIHERDRYTEFLMICLREIVTRRRNGLNVVLMSATLEQNALLEYWNLGCGGGGDGGGDVGVVSIPGRVFPVQEFFLEDILGMTKFVEEDGGEMGRLEVSLKNLLKEKSEDSKSKKKKKGWSGGKVRQQQQQQQQQQGLVCIMCNKADFKCPEELGTHVATCMGVAGCSLEELELKVRNTGIANVGYDNDAYIEEEIHDAYHDDDVQEPTSDDEMILWDGISPFDETPTTHKTTFTEEELLSRYHSVHDDDLIDNDLLLEILRYIIQSSYGDGAILVFFPGWLEISEFAMLLQMTEPFCDERKFVILPLHSGISSREQRKVFWRMREGVRKIVLATNIAETSVTIPDVAFVVDTGRAKEKNYDPHLKTSTLQPVWISQASAKQRKGRAGRTKPGVCFRLYSGRRFASFRPFLESELLRTPLEEMCLQCKRLNLTPGSQDSHNGIPSFFSKALSPPHPKSVINALELLTELGAMEKDTNDLTPLGKCLSNLSLGPRVGKMVIWSHLLGCARSASAMGVAMSHKSPFTLPPPTLRKKADMAKITLSRDSESDSITILHALRTRDRIVSAGKNIVHFCNNNFLSVQTLQMLSELRKHVATELSSLGFPRTWDAGYHRRNENSDVEDGPAYLLQAAILSGLYPNVAYRKRGDANFSTSSNRKAKVHVSSVNAVKGQPLCEKCHVDMEFVIFGEMVRGVNFFTMSQTTRLVSPVGLVLLCGRLGVRPAVNFYNENDADDESGEMTVLSVDDWIVFRCEKEVAASLVVLRKRLDRAFLDVVKRPSKGLNALSHCYKDAVETLGAVLKSAHNAMLKRR